ncbi:hypothetical protein NFI96_021458, partial [Prochilodus magdalenae]
MWRGECKLGFLAVLFVVFGCIAVTSGSCKCAPYLSLKASGCVAALVLTALRLRSSERFVLGLVRRPTRVGVICCEQVSRAPIPPSVTLVGYKRQNALAPCVEAIIFFSKTEKFCSNSTARWIERRLKGMYPHRRP